MFGKNSFLLARWFKEYHVAGLGFANEKDWWKMKYRSFSNRLDISDFVDLYNSTESPEQYQIMLDKLELSDDDFQSSNPEQYIEAQKPIIYAEIKEQLLKDTFFHNTLIRAILDGKEKNVDQYKKLSYFDALEKYNSARIFDKETPIKKYSNGYKWINVGKRCELVGNKLKNCSDLSSD